MKQFLCIFFNICDNVIDNGSEYLRKNQGKDRVLLDLVRDWFGGEISD